MIALYVLICCITFDVIFTFVGIGTIIYEWKLIKEYKKEIRDEYNHNCKDAGKDGV